MDVQTTSAQQTISAIENLVETTQREGDIKRLEQEKAKKKAQFEQSILQLTDRVIEAQDKNDEFTYTLLKTFLDLAVDMQKLMDDLESINQAMTCLTDAIGFIDSAINFDKVLIDTSMNEKYGRRSRAKLRRMQKKAIKNNVGRMLAVADMIYLKFDMANSMREAMTDMGIQIRRKMDKAAAKARKKAVKSGRVSPAGLDSGKPTGGDDLIAKRRAEMGKPAVSQGAETPSGDAPASGGNYDDIV